MLLMNEGPARQVENLRLVGQGYSQAYAARHEAEVTPLHTEFATERVVGDVDLFTDFLGGACMGQKCDGGERALRVPGRLQAADTPTVVHALLVATQRGDADDVLEASRELLKRYLADNAAHIARVAAELAAEA